MENQLVLPKLTITRIQVSKKDQMSQRRSRRRTCCLNDLFPRTSSPLKPRESRQTSSPCMNHNNTDLSHQHLHQHNDTEDHDSSYRVKVPSSDDSGPSSVSSTSSTPSIEDGDEEDLILTDILDDKKRIPKKRSNSAPTLVRIDSFQDRAMRLMRKRHSKFQKNRQRAHSANRSEENSEVFEPFSPTSSNTLLVPSQTSPDIMFALCSNSNGDLSVDRLVSDSNNNNVPDHSALIENANETVILTDSNGISMFITTKELVRSFELQRQIRRRRVNKKTISFDENLLRR